VQSDGRLPIGIWSRRLLTIHSRGTRIVPILVPLTQALGPYEHS
jgi:hypothetical protein